jgi:hypothetical protein
MTGSGFLSSIPFIGPIAGMLGLGVKPKKRKAVKGKGKRKAKK